MAAKLLTPEESAREILKIFIESNRRSGGFLQRTNLDTKWQKRGLSVTEFWQGIGYAESQDWIEVQNNKMTFCLTQKGFTEAKL
ncbi:MAG: hypothetical protein ACM3SR_11580 [Ignavibacteriales bacterium]